MQFEWGNLQCACCYHQVLLVACPRAESPWPPPEFYQASLGPASAHTTETSKPIILHAGL